VSNRKTKLEESVVGFFPNFFSIGETIPLLKIAKSYNEMGGKIVIFSHGGKFEYIAKEQGLDIINLHNYWKNFFYEGKKMVDKKQPFEKLFYKVYGEESLRSIVQDEIDTFKKIDMDLLVCAFNITTSISARALNIPLATLLSGTSIQPFFEAGRATFPDNYENYFTRIIPSKIKDKFTQRYLLRNKILTKIFNSVASDYGVNKFKTFNDLFVGEHSFVCDDINMLDISPTSIFPKENFIGPIFGGFSEKKEQKVDQDIINHIQREGKSILLTMGQGCSPQFFLKLLNCLNDTNYNAIAVHTGILKKEELPKTGDNILLKPFISNILEVNKMMDLAIIHGGRGTTYTAAYAAKPIIGMPMFIEQQYNLDNIVRKGAGIRISHKFFKCQKLIRSLDYLFSNYDKYLKNSIKLSQSLTKKSGEIAAAKRINEIVAKNN